MLADGMSSDKLLSILRELKASTGFVGGGSALGRRGKVELVATTGRQHAYRGVSVSPANRWHIGSIAKSVTATMIARLLEAEMLSLEMTPDHVFANGGVEVHGGWSKATFANLLNNAAGAAKNFPGRARLRADSDVRTQDARAKIVQRMLSRSPEYPPGDRFHYSNAGYVIAAHMAEMLTGQSWERLVEDQVLMPLGLSHTGLGAPCGSDGRQEPVGHVSLLGLKCPMPHSGWLSDYPAYIGPAASMHMSLSDLVRYGSAHVDGLNDQSEFLSSATFRWLHVAPEIRLPGRPPYAAGWRIDESGRFGAGRVSWHDGSNGRWYAMLVLVPARDAVFAFACNDGAIANRDEQVLEFAERAIDLLEPGHRAR